MSPDEFLEWIIPAAKNVCERYDLPYAVVVAQGAVESQWGLYRIGEYNIFGRKWGGWGNYIEVETEEYEDGWKTIIAKFQDYESLEQAIEDWCILMTEEEVYVNALLYVDKSDPFAVAEAISGIYATDPDYYKKIRSTMIACELV